MGKDDLIKDLIDFIESEIPSYDIQTDELSHDFPEILIRKIENIKESMLDEKYKKHPIASYKRLKKSKRRLK